MTNSASEVIPGSRWWRPILAAFLSLLIPGAGQWYAGRRRRALVVFAPAFLLLIAAMLTAAVLGPTDVVVILVRPSTLWALFGANLAVLAWRLIVVADAYFVTAEDNRRIRSPVTVTALLFFAVAVAVPHALAGTYGLRGIDVLESIFVVQDADAPPRRALSILPAPEADLIPDPVTIERRGTDAVTIEYRSIGMIFEEGVGDPDAIAVRRQLSYTAFPEAPFLPFEERVGAERLTVLLAGGDAGPGRRGLRTDTMIVATVDVTTGEAALFGLPRNFKMVPLPRSFNHAFEDLEREIWESEILESPDEDEDGYPDMWTDLDGDDIPDEPEFESCHCFPEMLNKLRSYTEKWSRSFEGSADPGMEALAQTVGHLLDLPIDYWMLVDMSGFVKLIDAMGGIDMMVAQAMHVRVSAPEEGLPKAGINVEPGLNHLSGSEALAYVRWRRGSSDYARMQRQRCLLRAVASQADPLTMLRSFSAIADAAETSVATNIPVSFLPDLVNVARQIDLGEVATVGLIPPRYTDGRTLGGYPIPDVPRMRAKVAQVLEDGAIAQSGNGDNECSI